MVMWISGAIRAFEPRPLTSSDQALPGCGCAVCRGRFGLGFTSYAQRDPNAIDYKAAEDIAVTLLADLCGGNQAVVEAIQRGYFEVTGNEGGIFRLFTRSYAGNIAYQAPDQRTGMWSTLCAHLATADECSRYENILGQIEMIRTNEQRFRQLAI